MVARTSIPADPSNYYPTRNRPIRVICIHTGETTEGPTAAEGMGTWFANPAANASTTAGADPDSICTYLPDTATPWAAPGINADGIHIELAGRAGQTTGQWDDAPSRLILANAAIWVREKATQHRIPVRWLTDAQLRAGERGLTTHAQASRVYGGTHWDPGPNFPAAAFLNLCTSNPPTTGADMALTPADAKMIWRSDIIPAPDGSTVNPTWQADSVLVGTYKQVAALRVEVAALAGQLDPAKFAAALAPLLDGATGTVVTQSDLEAALRTVLGSVDGATP